MLLPSDLSPSSAQRWGRLPHPEARVLSYRKTIRGGGAGQGPSIWGHSQLMMTLREVTRKINTLALLPPSSLLQWAHQSLMPPGTGKLGSPLVSPYACGVPMGQPPGMRRRVGGCGRRAKLWNQTNWAQILLSLWLGTLGKSSKAADI